MAKKTFVRGAMILSAAGIISKVLGAFFRIPLANLIGAEGMGYYQAVYPIYSLLLTVSIAGFPVAVSRMVSERIALKDHFGAHRVFRISLFVMIVFGMALSLFLFIGSDAIIGRVDALKGAAYAMRAISPALFFVTVMSAYMGYFQGMRNMKPSAVVQIVEQFFRVIIGLSLAFFLAPIGTSHAAAGAMFGASAGSVAGFIVILLIYFATVKQRSFKTRIAKSRRAFREKKQSVLRILYLLFAISVPITIGSAIMPIMSNIDLAIVANRLSDTGWAPDQVREMYGQLTGMAAPLVNLPQVVTQAIAISLVPTITAAFKTGDMPFLRYNTILGFRMTLLLGLPCALGFMTLSEPIMRLLYPAQPEDAVAAAPSLFILAVGIVFYMSIQTLTGALQGMGRQVTPVVNLFIGAICKAGVTYVLTGIPSINVMGAAAGTVCAYIVATALNLRAVKKYTGAIFDWRKTLLRPLLSALAMSVAAFVAFRGMSLFAGNAISVLVAIAAGGVVYAIMVFVTRAVTEDELIYFPKGETLVKLYRKVLTTVLKNGRM
ncbi:MAG: polysaccharide biosynthesis protein [Clostridiales Family XIII bacterium]|jgi:stage V sporulation protein B|nr:polysaccharide biosynthesis protein [Clostridiales Family XIII bacterium]